MRKIMLFLALSLSFGIFSTSQTMAQTQLLSGGNMELATDWMVSNLNSQVSATAVWNYSADAPAFGQGGNLYVSSTADENLRQYCIYQKLDLSNDKAYIFDGAVKDINGNVNDSWIEVFLGTKPVNGEDYGAGQKLLGKFSTWDACTHKNVDGTFKLNGCHPGAVSLDTSGSYYFVLKIGTLTNNGFDVLFDELSLVESTKPLTAFSASVTNGYAPLTVNFTDESALAESWAWNFGDGTTSTEQNPTHTYNVVGTYSVSLTATNSKGDSTLTKTDFISVKEIPELPVDGVLVGGNMEDGSKWQVTGLNTPIDAVPTATWNYITDTPGAGLGGNLYVSSPQGSGTRQFCIYQQVTLSSDKIYTFNGALKDIGTNLNESWIEVFIGTKPVDGSDYGAGATNIQIAGFSTWNSAISHAGLDGTFMADGNHIGQYNPDTSGTYYFVLKVGTNSGIAFDLLFDQLSLIEGTSKPYPAFSADNLTGFAPFTVNFINNSKMGETYAWDFGDGTSSTDENPQHTYTAIGKYTVSLTATNAQGDSTKTKIDYITVNEATELPDGEKLYGGNMENPDFWVITNLNATSIPVATWNYTADAPAAGVGGNLHVTATVNEQTSQYCIWQAVNLLADSAYVFDGLFKDIAGVDHFWCEVYIGNAAPVDGVDYNGDPEGIDMISYFNTWEGTGNGVDGTFSDNALNPMNPYQPIADGTYYFVLKLGNTDWEATDYSFEVLIDELSLKETTPVILPVAEFFADVTSGDSPLTVQFFNQSENATEYLWYFGDGTTSTEKDPSHTYNVGGSFTVSLVAKNETASDSIAKTDLIVVTGIFENKTNELNAYPNPSSDFIHIDLENGATGTLTIYNLIGEMVYSQRNLKESNRISVNELKSGIYIIKVESKGKIRSKKLIKN